MIFSDESLLREQDEKKTDPSDSNLITRAYLDSILIEERLIDSVVPDISARLFGKKFGTPVVMPAFSHMGRHLLEYAEAARELNALNFLGMSENDGFAEVMKVNPATVRIVKPYRDREKLRDQLRKAEELGAAGVGIDTDHSFGGDGYQDNVMGEAMEPLTAGELKDFVSSTKLPFMVKGVLSASDALKCREAGVKVILVSHHSNIYPYAVPPLMMLSAIQKALGGDSGMEILVDCGISRGADVYKAMALGANGAAVGRSMMKALVQDGVKGVVDYVEKMDRELRRLMARTGVRDTEHFDPSALWIGGKPVKD